MAPASVTSERTGWASGVPSAAWASASRRSLRPVYAKRSPAADAPEPPVPGGINDVAHDGLPLS